MTLDREHSHDQTIFHVCCVDVWRRGILYGLMEFLVLLPTKIITQTENLMGDTHTSIPVAPRRFWRQRPHKNCLFGHILFFYSLQRVFLIYYKDIRDIFLKLLSN